MTTLCEGDVEFEFHEGSEASHYDNWAFYRNQFRRLAGGSKAVNLLCIKDGYSWLVEVKDYRHHPRTKPSELHEEVATKVRDTLAGLAAEDGQKGVDQALARGAASRTTQPAKQAQAKDHRSCELEDEAAPSGQTH